MKKKSNSEIYAPLKFLIEQRKLDNVTHFFDLPIDKLKTIISPDEGVTEQERIQATRECLEMRKGLFTNCLDPLMTISMPSSMIESRSGYSVDTVKNAIISTLKPAVIIGQWQYRKQCYKFDKDFIEELLNTDTVTYSRNMLKYLPYKSFYVDLSDDKELCEKIGAVGFFFDNEISKDNETVWYNVVFIPYGNSNAQTIHCVVKNKDMKIKLEDLPKIENPAYSLTDNDYEKFKSWDFVSLKTIVYQIVAYLCTEKPDIKDSEITRTTYRKRNPSSKPKDKFSEVKVDDVGVHFGNAYRKWAERKIYIDKDGDEIPADRTPKGQHKKRPHARKAHWHGYWCGGNKGDPNAILRPKWVSDTFVNVKDDNKPESVDITYHSVKKSNQD